MSYLFSRFEQLKASGALPSPSGVALEILRLTQSDDAQISQLAHVLQADPALAGRLVKFANSAQAAASRPTVSISDAVKRLGFAVVRQLCLGFSVLNGHRDGGCPAFDYPRYWSRSLATAIAAQAFTVRMKTLAPDESFTCGLLAEIGSLALASLHPERYAQILQSGLEGAELLAAERKAFDVDHQAFSAALLEDWCLPKICVDAVFHSEQPERSGFDAGSRPRQLCEIIALSRLVGEYFVADIDARKLLAPPMLQRAGGMGIEAELLAQMCDTVAEGWQQWGPVLSVRTDAMPRLEFGLTGDADDLPAPQAAAAFAGVAPAVPAAAAGTPAAAAPTVPAATASATAAAPAAASAEPALAAAGSLAAPALPALKISVVSDEPVGRARICSLLLAFGHQVTAWADARSAIGAALADSPHVVIVDLASEAEGASTLCATLRATSIGQRIFMLGMRPAGKAPTQQSRMDRAPLSGPEAGPDDFLFGAVDAAQLDLRLRAARRALAVRDTLHREQSDLRKVASELAVAQRRLQRARITDALTGVFDRQHVMEQLARQWAAGASGVQPIAGVLTCMLLDLDHFGSFNALGGYLAGDHALAKTAEVLREVLPADSIVGRLCADQFMLLVPATAQAAAVEHAERLRSAVERSFATDRRAPAAAALTVSIGMAMRDDSVRDPDSLLRRAEKALQTAQREGGNRVRVATPAQAARASRSGPPVLALVGPARS